MPLLVLVLFFFGLVCHDPLPFWLRMHIIAMACRHAYLCPIGHKNKNVTYCQPFICTTVKNWSIACNVHALIAWQHFCMCLFDWPNMMSALDIALPSSLDCLNVSIKSADCNSPCRSTNKYSPYQCVQQHIRCSDSVPSSSYHNGGNDWRCLNIPSIHTLLS